MFLVTGPTGSGKTTTLYATLNALNNTERKIITVEDPVEYRLPGLNQVQVHEKIELSFERVLRAALRQDPDVVLVGEMRDQVTAEVGLRAAMTGHLVLSTLHTNDAALHADPPARHGRAALHGGALPAPGAGPAPGAHHLHALRRDPCADAAGARLVRGQWRETWRAPRSSAGRGCVHCSDTGYSGRTGVYEFLEMDQELINAAEPRRQRGLCPRRPRADEGQQPAPRCACAWSRRAAPRWKRRCACLRPSTRTEMSLKSRLRLSTPLRGAIRRGSPAWSRLMPRVRLHRPQRPGPCERLELEAVSAGALADQLRMARASPC